MDFPSLIESSLAGDRKDMRTLLLAIYRQLSLHNAVTGTSFLQPTNGKLVGQTAAPAQAQASAVGANGTITLTLTNPAQSANAALIHEVSYSTVKNFSQNVVTLPKSTVAHVVIPAPGQTVFIRYRSSIDGQTWNQHQYVSSGAVEAGLQSSAAAHDGLPLNQSNFAHVDSVQNGGSAAIRIYGQAGPYFSYVDIKGGTQRVLPSGTIANATYGGTAIIGYDGKRFRSAQVLPGIFDDSIKPVGSVNIVNNSPAVLPTLAPVISGGHIIAVTWTGDSGLTEPPILTVADAGGGTGAVVVCTGVTGGQMTGVQVLNPGTGYSGATTITATGGQFTGSTGGGGSTGGNGGRLVTL